MLNKTIAKYPLMRVEVKTFTTHADIMGESIDNVILRAILAVEMNNSRLCR